MPNCLADKDFQGGGKPAFPVNTDLQRSNMSAIAVPSNSSMRTAAAQGYGYESGIRRRVSSLREEAAPSCYRTARVK
jgi:hypothetical protein